MVKKAIVSLSMNGAATSLWVLKMAGRSSMSKVSIPRNRRAMLAAIENAGCVGAIFRHITTEKMRRPSTQACSPSGSKPVLVKPQ